jgi:hypothetical protein
MGKAMAKERAREIGDAWNQLANLLTVLEKARSATPPVQIASDDLDRNVCEELNCAEEVLDGLSVDLGMEKTDFDCIGDYIKAVFAAQAKCLTPPAPPSPEGMVLLPKRMTQAMRDVTDTEDWRWEDLLAAAEAITEGEYNELAAAQPAHLAQVVRAHIQDLRACLPTLREHKLSDTAAEVEKAANELEAAAAQPAPVQEPVAQSLIKALTHAVEIAEAKRPGTWDDLLQYRVLLNTPPAQRQWVGLTDAELSDAYVLGGLRLVQEKIKVKNNE